MSKSLGQFLKYGSVPIYSGHDCIRPVIPGPFGTTDQALWNGLVPAFAFSWIIEFLVIFTKID